jgi:hypothetical protein
MSDGGRRELNAAETYLVEQLKQFSVLESIVRDLAGSDLTVATSDGSVCSCCRFLVYGDVHGNGCVKKRAREWVRERDAEKGEGCEQSP